MQAEAHARARSAGSSRTSPTSIRPVSPRRFRASTTSQAGACASKTRARGDARRPRAARQDRPTLDWQPIAPPIATARRARELAPGALPRRVRAQRLQAQQPAASTIDSGEALCVVDLDTVMSGHGAVRLRRARARTGRVPGRRGRARTSTRVRLDPELFQRARGRASWRATRGLLSARRDPRARARGSADGARERRALPDRSSRRRPLFPGRATRPQPRPRARAAALAERMLGAERGCARCSRAGAERVSAEARRVERLS